MRSIGLVALAAMTGFALAGSALSVSSATTSSDAPENVTDKAYDPTNFRNSTKVDNKWIPLRPGTQLVFKGTTEEGNEKIPHRVVFTVTDLVKQIDGVESVVLWDRDYSDGELVEAEIAFFAQDDDGNVWQMGEYPEEYEGGKILASPLWIHGLQGARAGLTMRAVVKKGTPSYSLGWGPAVGFNDRARIMKTGSKTCVPLRCYRNVLVTDEYNPDEPGKHQLKYYAPNVGNVRVGWAGKNEESKETLVLVAVKRLTASQMDYARAAARKLEASAYERKKAYGATAPMERR
jgi:ketosteroid isomerase-like protein